MTAEPPTTARDALLRAGTDLFRRAGFVGTSVGEICAAAGVTKGAFFHHFPSKEALGEACLEAWDAMAAALDEQGTRAELDPRARAVAFMDFYRGVLSDPSMPASCLAGTTVQEVAETHPALRRAAQRCFESAGSRFTTLLDAAAAASGRELDTASLAALWMATLQGALVLAKASGDPSVVPASLAHVRDYIAGLLAD